MPFPTFTVTQKKVAAIWLLAGSCMIAVLIMFITPSERQERLSELALADSLIQQELSLFNISSEYIRIFDYPVTDQFTRKRYVVNLPVQVSKTHLHAKLNSQFRQFGVSSIGYVDVPDRKMSLHLFYRDKIIRTLELRTEPDYVRIPHPATLFIYFDRRPTAYQLERIRMLGIPANIVLRSASRRSLVRWTETLPEDLTEAGIWFDDVRTTYDELIQDDAALFRTLAEVAQIHNRPVLLDFSADASWLTAEQKERLESLNIAIREAGDMIILSSEDRFKFDRQMLTYSRLARQAGRPRLLVRGTDRTLDWLEEWIPRIKRGGVIFVTP